MKKLFLILMLSASMAFAMPAPSQIESALAAHDYQSAKSMTQEVLREKPDSAKAHLFNAYVILKTTNNKLAASEELNTASRLDKNGSVKNSALFGRTVAEIEASPVARMAPTTRQSVQAYTYPAVVQQTAPEGSHWLMWTFIIGGGGALVYYMLRNSKPVVMNPSPYTRSSDSYDNPSTHTRSGVNVERSYDSAPQIRRQEDRSYPQPMYAAPAPVVQQTGMTAMGTFAATAGGVVAGNAISNMLHNSDSHRHHGEYVREYREIEPKYYPTKEAEPEVNYETKRSSYSSGSSSSWSSDDNSSSSSSSWDSGSSSSSSDSSSGGGWD